MKTQTKKEPCFAGFPACGGSHKRHLHIRRSAIPRRDFYLTGNFREISCQIKIKTAPGWRVRFFGW